MYVDIDIDPYVIYYLPMHHASVAQSVNGVLRVLGGGRHRHDHGGARRALEREAQQLRERVAAADGRTKLAAAVKQRPSWLYMYTYICIHKYVLVRAAPSNERRSSCVRGWRPPTVERNWPPLQNKDRNG